MQRTVGTFTISDELAQQLTDLMAKRDVYESLMIKAANDPAAFEMIEGRLLDTVRKYDAVRNRITDELLPNEYRNEKYTWSYRGWEVDKNVITVWE